MIVYAEAIEKKDTWEGLMTGWWECKNCSERIQNQFDACWNCGSARDLSDATVQPDKYVLPERPDCPKCGFKMNRGHLRDRMDTTVSVVAEWMEGTSREGRGLKLYGYRCDNCGFVELYAPRE
jgi:predicted Zn-ribbon and HTH transcriptional regulator